LPISISFFSLKWKSSLKRAHFQSTEDTYKETALLTALSQNGIREWFKAQKACLEQYIAANINYFEGDNI